MNKKTIGWLERVWFPEFDLAPEGVIAKIDTGADSGAIHCMFYKVKKDENGKEFVEFQPLDTNRPAIRTQKFKWVRVKSSNGTDERRPRIETIIRIKDTDYPIKLSLTDRSDMKYDVIIGWRFLEGKFLVDVSKSNI